MMTDLAGFVIIDKPAGLTSHDVVAHVRRLVGRVVKVGHAGTLDPMATGVLPVALGSATRLLDQLVDTRKGYLGVVRLGIQTTTDDADGEPLVTQAVPELTPETIETVLTRFRGDILQQPPAFSALHIDGQRAYALARAGNEVTLAPKPVRIERLDLLAVALPDLTIAVECSKGTYIRALARDIGAALGCGGHLASLQRIFTGPFRLEHAIPLAALTDRGAVMRHLLPPETALLDWPLVQLDATNAYRILHGMSIPAGESTATRARAHDPDGKLIALLRRNGERWQPVKVFRHR
ncbi:tRNA pseudouridine(55) synthase TruB [Chloroflexus aggregans]|uniref:tRNA pseudouridine synthase B n=1 Tax=Chloroflexus aggregans (strain MD-66 / DSM 9485) TaxID=326427 RepID=B8G9Q4_CHLAD|nr:tRNA pseudouridine(55) synthase TruB [Chloroflexus aggregans]ACL26407.1 tRNA pseudouridine synthase B [Chloroflexus aggregans DSM 9485]